MAAEPVSQFGSNEASSAAMVGILYDLKQDQARKPMKMNIPEYGKLVDEFIASGWDEGVLNRYFRAARPLYTTQVFIPLISAGAAPKAFGVETIVKPNICSSKNAAKPTRCSTEGRSCRSSN